MMIWRGTTRTLINNGFKSVGRCLFSHVNGKIQCGKIDINSSVGFRTRWRWDELIGKLLAGSGDLSRSDDGVYIWSRELVSCVWTVDNAISVSIVTWTLIIGNLMPFHLIFWIPLRRNWNSNESKGNKERGGDQEVDDMIVRIIENAFFVTRIDGAKARRTIRSDDCCLMRLDHDLTFWTWH